MNDNKILYKHNNLFFVLITLILGSFFCSMIAYFNLYKKNIELYYIFQGLVVLLTLYFFSFQWNKTEFRKTKLERRYPFYPSKNIFLQDIELTYIDFHPMRYEYLLEVHFLHKNKKNDSIKIVTHHTKKRLEKFCKLLVEENIHFRLQEGFRFD